MYKRKLRGFLLLLILCSTVMSADTTPQLYHTTDYQSPSETQSNRIVTIPGYDIDANASVYYEEVTDTNTIPNNPDFLPSDNSNKKEFLNVISNNDAPYSLSVKFPKSATQDKIYALWVKNRQGSWSKRVLLNDPRPQWIFPKRGYTTKGFSTFGRRYFLAGRNLKLAADKELPITLTNDTTNITYEVIPKIYKEKSAEHLLYFDLPQSMQEGNYTVTMFNRESENKLLIEPDPTEKKRFNITDYGAIPNDNQDDTPAMRDAIAATVANGSGEVYFPEGTWRLVKTEHSNLYGGEHLLGHIVKPNIDLVGAGKEKTIIKRVDENCDEAFFTLQGNNIVKGISFIDELSSEEYRVHSMALYIGKPPWWKHIDGPEVVENVQIEACYFSNMEYAISTRGLPARELYVSNNIFHPHSEAVGLGGDPTLKYPDSDHFTNKDGVIFNNTMFPGGAMLYGDVNGETIAIQGPIAIELSGTVRFSVVDNLLDGRGAYNSFRAGMFWHTADSSEHTLVANNKLHCTGDRANWGEAIAIDTNYNDSAFIGQSEILEATLSTITPVKTLEANVTNQYLNYWVYVTEGPGIGQARKVVHNKAAPNTPIEIFPQWDVVPVVDESKVVISRSYNWLYIVNNLVDQKSGCSKTNPLNESGEIYLGAMKADSVVSYNTQYDTAGISISGHNGDDGTHSSPYNILIKENFIDGKYSEESNGGGITLSYGKLYEDREDKLIMYNVDVFKNRINNSWFKYGESDKTAIAYFLGHWSPTSPKAFKNTIISQNRISNVDNGIGLSRANSSDVLYFNHIICDNIFENIDVEKVEAFGVDTVRCH
ncbi:hypothetical protein KKC13_12215 [bacterium]|nr:hypothetical protein [bacterium]MBU1958724.1 hypothetical protein [bacterium]